MSRAELVTEIERFRSELNDLATGKVDHKKLLEVSQVLDKLIVEYYRTAG